MTTRAFTHYPARPRSAECINGFTILTNAHDTAESFHEASGRFASRDPPKEPTDEEQDLLRASLIFAASGLDSMAKQLIRDALPSVVDKHKGAELQFKTFIARRLRSEDGDTTELLADALGSKVPRLRLVEMMVDTLTASSLQSADEVLRIGAFFDVPSAELVADIDQLRSVFRARNQIVHEMDVDFTHVNRNRRSRTKADMTSMTNRLFGVASRLLSQVDDRCVEP